MMYKVQVNGWREVLVSADNAQQAACIAVRNRGSAVLDDDSVTVRKLDRTVVFESTAGWVTDHVRV